MGHIPYGYRIESGRAVINESEANIIRNLYKEYLSGKALKTAAHEAGLETYHCSAKRIMQNRHYLGDDFYPAIIDKDIFDAVAAEIERRAEKLGRTNMVKGAIIKPIPTRFTISQPVKEFTNPLKQTEYLYSLITEANMNET